MGGSCLDLPRDAGPRQVRSNTKRGRASARCAASAAASSSAQAAAASAPGPPPSPAPPASPAPPPPALPPAPPPAPACTPASSSRCTGAGSAAAPAGQLTKSRSPASPCAAAASRVSRTWVPGNRSEPLRARPPSRLARLASEPPPAGLGCARGRTARPPWPAASLRREAARRGAGGGTWEAAKTRARGRPRSPAGAGAGAAQAARARCRVGKPAAAATTSWSMRAPAAQAPHIGGRRALGGRQRGGGGSWMSSRGGGPVCGRAHPECTRAWPAGAGRRARRARRRPCRRRCPRPRAPLGRRLHPLLPLRPPPLPAPGAQAPRRGRPAARTAARAAASAPTATPRLPARARRGLGASTGRRPRCARRLPLSGSAGSAGRPPPARGSTSDSRRLCRIGLGLGWAGADLQQRRGRRPVQRQAVHVERQL